MQILIHFKSKAKLFLISKALNHWVKTITDNLDVRVISLVSRRDRFKCLEVSRKSLKILLSFQLKLAHNFLYQALILDAFQDVRGRHALRCEPA